jgi:hypothetical protein
MTIESRFPCVPRKRDVLGVSVKSVDRSVRVNYRLTTGMALLLCALTVPVFHVWVWFFFR